MSHFPDFPNESLVKVLLKSSDITTACFIPAQEALNERAREHVCVRATNQL